MKSRILAILLLIPLVVYAAEQVELVMKAGEDYRADLYWKDSTGRAINLKGKSFSAQFRSAPYPGGTVYGNYSVVFINASTGHQQLRMSKSQTRAASGKAGVWDLKQTDADGRVSYRFGGPVRVMPTVTQ